MEVYKSVSEFFNFVPKLYYDFFKFNHMINFHILHLQIPKTF